MAQTVVITPTAAAANSTDIVVGATPVAVAVYATANEIGRDAVCTLQRKTTGGNYQTVTMNGKPVVLGIEYSTSFAIAAPGTYRVVKPVTVGLVGVLTET